MRRNQKMSRKLQRILALCLAVCMLLLCGTAFAEEDEITYTTDAPEYSEHFSYQIPAGWIRVEANGGCVYFGKKLGEQAGGAIEAGEIPFDSSADETMVKLNDFADAFLSYDTENGDYEKERVSLLINGTDAVRISAFVMNTDIWAVILLKEGYFFVMDFGDPELSPEEAEAKADELFNSIQYLETDSSQPVPLA